MAQIKKINSNTILKTTKKTVAAAYLIIKTLKICETRQYFHS